MNEDNIYTCIIPFWVGEDEEEIEVPTGSKWLLSPSSPEGYDVAVESLEKDSCLQVWMDYGRLDKHFIKEVTE